MPLFIKLRIAQAVSKVHLYPKLIISLFKLKELVFISHLVDSVPIELSLVLKAEVARPEDK